MRKGVSKEEPWDSFNTMGGEAERGAEDDWAERWSKAKAVAKSNILSFASLAPLHS